MNSKIIAVLVALALAPVAGCASSDQSATSTLLDSFSAESSTSVNGSFAFTAKGGVGSIASAVALPLASAPMHLELTEKSAELSSLSIPLGEVMVSARALPPNGLHIRNLALTVEAATTASIDARTIDAVSMHTKAPVSLSWEMEVAPGEFYALAPAKIPGLEFEIGVVQDIDGQDLLTVDARCAGACWGLKGIVEVSDVALHFDAPVLLHMNSAGAATR